MASQALVEIILRVRDSASQALRGVTEEVKDLDRAFFAVGAASFAAATAMTLTAARTEELGVVVQAMSRSHDIAVGHTQAIENSIKALGITTQAARLLIAQLIGSNVGLARATDLARAAQDLAVLGMTDSSEAAADLAYAIASLQPRLLRKYRIYVSLVDVYRRAALELGKNITQLTETEKQQAFLNAVLDEAAEYSGLYEAAMTTAGKQLRTLRREVQETANELGEHMVPMLGGVVMVASDFLAVLRDLPDPLQAATIYVMALVGATATLQKGLALLSITVSGPVIATLVALTGGTIAVYANQQRLNEAFADTEFHLLQVYDSYEQYSDAVKRAYWEQSNLLNKVMILGTSIDGMTMAVRKSNKEWEEAKNWLPMIIKGWREYDDVITAIPGTLEGMSQMYKELGRTMIEQRAAVQALRDTYISMAGFLADAVRAAEEHAGDLLTIQRRRTFMENEIATKGWTEKRERQLESLIQEEHAAEVSGERMLRQQERRLGMMLIQAAQAAGLSVEIQKDIGVEFGVFTEELWAKAGFFIKTIDAMKAEAITTARGIQQMAEAAGIAAPGVAVPTIAAPVPAVLATVTGQLVAIENNTVAINALTDTMRGGKRLFAREGASYPDLEYWQPNELRLEGVITR